MSTPSFDLVDMAKLLQGRRKFLLTFTLVSMVLGTILYLVLPQKYEAAAEILIANPMVADRSYMFRTTEPRYIDFFAGEDDIDHVMAIALSETVRNKVIARMDLYKAYELNEADRDDQEKMGKRWKKHYDVTRTEYKNMMIAFKDTDPNRAANVANDAVKVIETTYRGYYNSIKTQINNSIQSKINAADSAITSLTDTLAKLRSAHGIYDIVNPARANVINGNFAGRGSAEFGKGLELVQNLESIKDQYVIDRTKYISLMNEFATGTQLDDMEFVQVISPASPPKEPAGLGLVLSIIAFAFVGFFVSVCVVLMSGYFSALTSVQR